MWHIPDYTEKRFVIVCAWCKKYLLDNKTWVIPNHDDIRGKNISHGICPDCRTKQLNEEHLDNL